MERRVPVRFHPFASVGELPAEVIESLLHVASELLRANLDGGARVTLPDAGGGAPGALSGKAPREGLWVYGRAGRPCRRCGTPIRSTSLGSLPRRLYWCPACQPARPPQGARDVRAG